MLPLVTSSARAHGCRQEILMCAAPSFLAGSYKQVQALTVFSLALLFIYLLAGALPRRVAARATRAGVLWVV